MNIIHSILWFFNSPTQAQVEARDAALAEYSDLHDRSPVEGFRYLREQKAQPYSKSLRSYARMYRHRNDAVTNSVPTPVNT